MVGARPTIVFLPSPWAMGAFHPLGRLGLGAGGRGGRLISESDSESTELE